MTNIPEAEQDKNDPLRDALESLREEDKEPVKDDYNWALRERTNELERQVATLTTELQKRDKYIESLTEQVRNHFSVIKDLASALTVR